MQKVGSASPHPIYQHSPSPRYHPHSQREDLGDVEYEQEQFEDRPVHRMMLPKSHKVPNEEKGESSGFQDDRTGQFDEFSDSKQGNINEDRNNLSDERQEWRGNNDEGSRNRNDDQDFSSDINKRYNDEGSLNRNDDQDFSSDINKRYNDEGSLNRNDDQDFSSDSNRRYNDEGSRNRNDEQDFSSDSNRRYNDEGSRNRNDEQDVSSDRNKDLGQADAGYNFDRKDNQEERKESGDDNEVFPNLQKEDESALIEAGPPPEKQWSADPSTKEGKTNFEDKQSTVPQNRSRFEEKEDKIHRDIWNQPNPRAQNPEEWGKDVGDIESSNKSFDDRGRVHFQERGKAHLTGTWEKDQNQGQRNVSQQQQQRSLQTKDPANVTIAGVMAMTVPTDEFAPTDADLMLERERLARLQSETARLHGGVIPKGSNVSDAQSSIARKELDKDQGIDKKTITVPIVMKGETDLHHNINEKETESQRLHHIHDDVMEEIRGGTHLDSFDRK